jgi:hypothetical protein
LGSGHVERLDFGIPISHYIALGEADSLGLNSFWDTIRPTLNGDNQATDQGLGVWVPSRMLITGALIRASGAVASLSDFTLRFHAFAAGTFFPLGAWGARVLAAGGADIEFETPIEFIPYQSRELVAGTDAGTIRADATFNGIPDNATLTLRCLSFM